MNRRDALKNFALVMGGTFVGANALLTGCSPEHQLEGLDFSPEDIAFLDEIGEAIIPTTDTPGAKATEIGAFMVMMVKDTYNKDQQEAFVKGVNTIRKEFKQENGKDFMAATLEERTAYLNGLHQKNRAGDNENSHGIGMFKDLTVLGYFTSEIGATQQLKYVEAPGRYDGCVDYKPGDKAYAL